MDVRENRDIDSVIVLGCGKSILDLTETEKSYINRCKTVIAMNKFMAFYKMSGLLPTHVYFVDDHENSRKFLAHIFDICQKDNLKGLTFILNKSLEEVCYTSKRNFLFKVIKSSWKDFKISLKLFCVRYFFKTNRKYISQIKNCTYQFISITDWLTGGQWANNLTEKLFHFRGSLTTILNYCTICSPQRDIYLVGNDFSGSEYFFEKELKNFSFEWKDWTTDLSKKENKHFTFVNYQGTNIKDVFPFILKEIEKRKSQLFCINPNSLLTKECNIPYKSIPSV